MSDNNLVKTIVLSNRDRFYFSRNYDDDLIASYLADAEKAYAQYKYLTLWPGLISKMEVEFLRKSIYGTAAIEGNPLNEDQVGELLKNGETASQNRSKQEIINLARAYEQAKTMNRDVLSERDILAIHELLMSGIDSPGGTYRHTPVKIGDAAHGGTEVPPQRFKEIKLLMKEFIRFINSPEIVALDPMIRGGLAHYHFARIHPFSDGNGRTARLIEALLMGASPIRFVPALMSNYYHEHLDEYYSSFSTTRKDKSRDVTPFLEFVSRGVIDSVNFAGKEIVGRFRTASFEKHFQELLREKVISRRQLDLLEILLHTSTPFTFSDLTARQPFSLIYRTVSPRTAQRDLKKLMDMNLLEKNDNGTYELNLRALG